MTTDEPKPIFIDYPERERVHVLTPDVIREIVFDCRYYAFTELAEFLGTLPDGPRFDHSKKMLFILSTAQTLHLAVNDDETKISERIKPFMAELMNLYKEFKQNGLLDAFKEKQRNQDSV